jgi:alkylhydroperoxidase family enzyme
MPRIPYVDPKQHPELADLVKQIAAERGGRASELYTMLLNSPTVCAGWLHLLTALRHQITIPGVHREAVIVRIAILNNAPYEYKSHAKIAVQEGMTQAQIDALPTWQESDQFDPQLRAVLAYCDAMTRDIRVPDAVFSAVRAIYDEKQMIELTALIGAYNMVSRFLETLKVGA